MRKALIGLVAAGCMLLAGCGAGSHPAKTQRTATDGCTTSNARSAVTVDATNYYRFVPAKVCLKAGGTVTWKNVTSTLSHTSTDEPSIAANPQDAGYPAGAHGWYLALPPGGSAHIRLTVVGVYHYFCVPHETLGMVGSIVVVR